MKIRALLDLDLYRTLKISNISRNELCHKARHQYLHRMPRARQHFPAYRQVLLYLNQEFRADYADGPAATLSLSQTIAIEWPLSSFKTASLPSFPWLLAVLAPRPSMVGPHATCRVVSPLQSSGLLLQQRWYWVEILGRLWFAIEQGRYEGDVSSACLEF